MLRKIIFFAGGVLLIWHLYVLLPVLFHNESQVGALQIFDRHDQLIAEVGLSDGYRIELGEDEEIPELIKEAFLKIEDERFDSHWGVDLVAKLRALKDNISAGRVVSGGSTITEQYIKNRYFPTTRRSFLQKGREATLAFYLSIFRSKKVVFRNYLNTVYFGHRNYGLKTALKVYFDKSHLELVTKEELATMLAILRSPGTLQTQEQHFINRLHRIQERLEMARHNPVALQLQPFKGVNLFPHVTATIRQLVPVDYSGVVQTTIDSSLQKKAKELIELSLLRLDGKNVTNGALYVVQPNTGDVLVWQGSRDFYSKAIDGQVNVITQQRQMGSALKPFIYLFAFEQGAHPDQLIVDLEKDFQTAKEDEAYRPLNYGLREGGVMPLKVALANSFNIASVRLLEHLGLQEGYDFLKELGLPFDQPARHYGLSLALGTPDLPMQAVADTYAVLANNGQKVSSHLLREKSDYTPVEIPEPSVGFFHLFETLSNPLNRRRSFGTNSILNTTVPFAVKTGTTKNFHDNWTFGYHPDLVVASWVGNNDNSPMSDVDGITGAGPIWHRMVEFATEKGYISAQTKLKKPETLELSPKCLNADCSRTELIYQEPSRVWHSNLEKGQYCLEDFYITDIDVREIAKAAKLFDFQDFSIRWCTQSGVNKVNELEKQEKLEPSLVILKPEDGEVFYLRRDIPLDLQKIIVKANRKSEWFLNNEKVGEDIFLFLDPIVGQHTIKASQGGFNTSVSIRVQYAEE